MRELDRRSFGFEGFPNLHYPNIFVLDGGYKRFHELFPTLCVDNYIPMDDSAHRLECRQATKDWNAAWTSFNGKLSLGQQKRRKLQDRPATEFKSYRSLKF